MLGDFNPNLHYFYLNTVCYTWRVRSNYIHMATVCVTLCTVYYYQLSFLLESTLFLFEHRFRFLASSADFKLYQTLYILGHLRLSLHYFYLNTVSFTWRVRQKFLCKQIISTLYQTFYILRYLHLLQHYFCLNTVCFTWRVRHKYLCKLEQHQGIPWATRSVSEQCIC